MTPSNWRRLWNVSLVCSVTTLFATSAWAGEKHCDPKDPKSCVQAVSEGETVPFPGQLMTHRRAAKLVTTTEQCSDERALDLEEANELHQIQLNLLEQQRKNDQDAAKLKLDLMMKRMEQMEEELGPKWYEHPAFVSTVSVVLTVAVFIGAVKTVEALQ